MKCVTVVVSIVALFCVALRLQAATGESYKSAVELAVGAYERELYSCTAVGNVLTINVALSANYIYRPAYLTVEVTWDDPNNLGGNEGVEWSVDGRKWYSTERTKVPVMGGARTPAETMVRFRSVNPQWACLDASDDNWLQIKVSGGKVTVPGETVSLVMEND